MEQHKCYDKFDGVCGGGGRDGDGCLILNCVASSFVDFYIIMYLLALLGVSRMFKFYRSRSLSLTNDDKDVNISFGFEVVRTP